MTAEWETLRAVWLVVTLDVSMIPLGAVPLWLCWRLHKGRWGRVLGPPMRAAMATVPLTLILLVPLLSQEPLAGIAILLGWLIAWWCAQQDGTRSAPVGLILYTLSTSFAGFYWVLALQPEADSSIFGLIMIAHQMVGALAFAILFALLDDDRVETDALGGLGNMLLGAVMLWAYFEFMQYLVAWSGDQPRLLSFFLPRLLGAWGGTATGVFLLLGGVPFAALLFRAVRRSRIGLIALSALVLGMSLVEGIWLVVPVIDASFLSILIAAAIGSLVWAFGFHCALAKVRHG